MRALLVAVVALTACHVNQGANDEDAGPGTGWLLDPIGPDTGFRVRTPEFQGPAGTEVQDCYFFRVPDLAGGQDLWIDRFELGLNPGSHHMNLFRVKTIHALDPAAGEPVSMGGVDGVVIHGGECWK